MARRRRHTRTRLGTIAYFIKMLWFPVVCLAVAFGAWQMSNRSNDEPLNIELAGSVEEKETLPSPVTPVLSARRLPATVATPGRDARLKIPLLAAVGKAPADTCVVVRGTDGRDIFAHNPNAPLTPASTLKILTAYAALDQLGASTTFSTALVTNATANQGTIQGDVWLVGGGDPVLASDSYAASYLEQPQIHTPLAVLADRLVSAGITAISGRVHGDGTRYDDDYYVDDWPGRFAGVQSGPVSAVGVNDGYTSYPDEGQLRGGSGDRSATENAESHAARVFTILLEERGINVGGSGSDEPAPPGATQLAVIESPPLGDIVRQMLTASDNRTAEMLLKEIGLLRLGQGSTDAGTAAVTQILVENGLFTADVILADGSGLTSSNQMTCDLLVDILEDLGPDSILAQGLAIAGQSGTLLERFNGTAAQGRLRGKTGTLNGVSALAGYVETVPGEKLAFATILNGEGADEMKALEEEIGIAITRYPEGPSLEQLGPVPVDESDDAADTADESQDSDSSGG